MKIPLAILILLVGLNLQLPAAPAIKPLGGFFLPKGSGEIVAIDGQRQLLVTTRDSRWKKGLEFIDLSNLSKPRRLGFLSLKKAMPGGLESVSSVAIDPLQRGFAVVALIPKKPTRRRGAVAVVDLATRRVITTVPTGFHPDCVSFSPNGKFVAVACEGEFRKGEPNTPGSLSYGPVGDPRALRLYDAPIPVAFPGLRRLRLPNDTVADLEPEYLTIQGNQCYVTLQENNGFGIFDLRRHRWQTLRDLGSWQIRLDPSDRDGPDETRAVLPNKRIHALPMPDTITSFRWRGKTYLVTANEGDDANTVRGKKLGKDGQPDLDPAYRKRLTDRLGSDPLDDRNFGRLKVAPFEGDLDGDGDLDRLTTVGTRSFSIWEAKSGRRVYDSGFFFANVGREHPELFNVNNGDPNSWDTRSDNHGTEPEAVAAKIIRSRPIIAIATERQNVVYFFDASNPARPKLLGALNEMARNHFSPESIVLLPAAESPTGRPLAAVGWEGSSSVTFYEL